MILLQVFDLPAALSSGDIGLPLNCFGFITLMLLLLSAQSPHQVNSKAKMNTADQALAALQSRLHAQRTAALHRAPTPQHPIQKSAQPTITKTPQTPIK